MRDLLVDLNRYLSKYKYVIGFLVIVVILFLLVARESDKMRNSVGDSRANSTISESVSNENSVDKVSQNANITKVEDVSNYIETESDTINAFYLLCKDKKIDLAYEMLSDDCKNILYPSVEDFKNNYYNVIFKSNKDIEIIRFKNDTYRINFFEEAISTGNTKSIGTTDYVTLAGNNKLNISGFIYKQQLNTNSVEDYFSAQVLEKQVFVDYEIIRFSIQNNTKADIYINDANENGMYIEDTNGKASYVSSGEYYNVDYFVPAESKKTFTIKFEKKYERNSEDSKLYFNNIKVVNKKYYENTNGTSVERSTKYPEKTSTSINL